jgi:phosphomannomutase
MKDLLLFDVDNTLTVARGEITPEMIECIKNIKSKPDFDIGCVSGSDLEKMSEQLKEAINFVDWKFTENGLVTYFDFQSTPFSKVSFVTFLGEEKYQQLVNRVLQLLSTITLPLKRGTFLELRTGLLNVCPIGRSCTQKERDMFTEFDRKTNTRKKICDILSSEFPDLTFSIGGNISIDVFPKGWDKTYCLQFISQKYDKIYFFGDNIRPGGNDYEIGTHKRVIGRSVENWQQTLKILNETFLH